MLCPVDSYFSFAPDLSFQSAEWQSRFRRNGQRRVTPTSLKLIVVGPDMNEREIFTKARQLAGLPRAQFLDSACSDRAVRERVEELLEMDASMAPILDRTPGGILDDLADEVGEPETAEETERQVLELLDSPGNEGSLGQLAHYEVERVLGYGGYGIVLKAFDEKLHRNVAIKVLAPKLAEKPDPRHQFTCEARATAAVRHEHVVQIFAIEDTPVPYLVTEFIDGKTVYDIYSQDGHFLPTDVIRFGKQIASGLQAAHDVGIVHRDVKPANILIESVQLPRVKITDFGLAGAADDSTTQGKLVAGTPMFMSPEQAMGGDVDHRADLFSLGSVLYTMCTGRPPFRARGTFSILKRVVEDSSPAISEIAPTVPRVLCEVIERLHQKDPDKRFQSAAEVVQELELCTPD